MCDLQVLECDKSMDRIFISSPLMMNESVLVISREERILPAFCASFLNKIIVQL